MRYCWKWSRDNGMMSNTDYPYTGGGDADCQHDDTKAISYVSEWGKCDSPACALTRLQAGPVAIAVAAGNDCWRFYSSGVLTSADNCPTEVDHAVAIIGLEFGKPIWTKRLECKWFNSWDYQNQSCLADYNGFSCNRRDLRDFSSKSDNQKGTPIDPSGQIDDFAPIDPADPIDDFAVCRHECCWWEYDVTVSDDVWVVQNSWSANWGDSGFIRLKMEGDLGVSGMNQFIKWVRVQ